MIGRCFVLSQDLRVRDELDGGEWKFCEGRPQGHDRFGSCQQGLAAAFSPDHHYVLFGAPGTYNWKGEGGVRGVGGVRAHAHAWGCVFPPRAGVWGCDGCEAACEHAVGVSVWLRECCGCEHMCVSMLGV